MTTGVNAVIDPDYMPAKDKVIPQVVDALNEQDEWYAEQEGPSSIVLVTPLGKFEVVVVQSD